MPERVPKCRWVGLPDFLSPDIESRTSTLELAKGQTVFHAGDQVEFLYFVRAGELAGVRSMPNGAEAIMLTARAGEFFGEASLFQSVHSCKARALSASVITRFNVEHFRQAMALDSALVTGFVRMVTQTGLPRRASAAKKRD